MNPLEKAARAVDGYQQRRDWLAFPFGVVKKFGDDRAGQLAALIAYYGFFSLFPLLLVLVSILGIVLADRPELRAQVLETALANFPVVGDEIRTNVGSLEGSGLSLAVGFAGTLWAGLGVMQAAQNAMNGVWNIPRAEWPNFLLRRVRAASMLLVLSVIVLASTGLSTLVTSETSGVAVRVLTLAGTTLLNLLLFTLSFQLLTARNLRWRDVLPGAVLAAAGWTAMQSAGTFFVTRRLSEASDVYGTFALVIGLLVWLHLGAKLTLFCAEINVVWMGRLWPRSLVQPPLTEGDKEMYRDIVETHVMRPEQEVTVDYDESKADGGS